MAQFINCYFLRIFDFSWNYTSAFEKYQLFFVYFRIASAPSATKKYPVTWYVIVELKYNKTVSLIHIAFLFYLWCERMVYIIFLCNIYFVFRITYEHVLGVLTPGHVRKNAHFVTFQRKWRLSVLILIPL